MDSPRTYFSSNLTAKIKDEEKYLDTDFEEIQTNFTGWKKNKSELQKRLNNKKEILKGKINSLTKKLREIMIKIKEEDIPSPDPEIFSLLEHHTDFAKSLQDERDDRNMFNPYQLGDSSFYIGQISDNEKRDGYGQEISADGKVLYIGYYQKNEKKGKFIYIRKSHIEGRTEAIISDSEDSYIEVDGDVTGKVAVYYQDGDFYEGTMENGEFEGNGSYSHSNGERYVGAWMNDVYHGKGFYSWPKGGGFRGMFENGVRSGEGVLDYANGWRYKGDWRDGVWHGEGVLFKANGEVKHDGEFFKGRIVED